MFLVTSELHGSCMCTLQVLVEITRQLYNSVKEEAATSKRQGTLDRPNTADNAQVYLVSLGLCGLYMVWTENNEDARSDLGKPRRVMVN